jgi:hypothetical protein
MRSRPPLALVVFDRPHPGQPFRVRGLSLEDSTYDSIAVMNGAVIRIVPTLERLDAAQKEALRAKM